MAAKTHRRNAALKEAMTKTQILDALAESTGLKGRTWPRYSTNSESSSSVTSTDVRWERYVSRPTEDQGGAQTRDKGPQDDLALHGPGNHCAREARLAGRESSAPERPQVYGGVGPDRGKGVRLCCAERTRWFPTSAPSSRRWTAACCRRDRTRHRPTSCQSASAAVQ